MPLTPQQAVQELERRGWSAVRDRRRRGWVVTDDRGVMVTSAQRAESSIAQAVERAVADALSREARGAAQEAKALVLKLEQGVYPRSFLVEVEVDGQSAQVTRWRPARHGADLDSGTYETAREALLAVP